MAAPRGRQATINGTTTRDVPASDRTIYVMVQRKEPDVAEQHNNPERDAVRVAIDGTSPTRVASSENMFIFIFIFEPYWSTMMRRRRGGGRGKEEGGGEAGQRRKSSQRSFRVGRLGGGVGCLGC